MLELSSPTICVYLRRSRQSKIKKKGTAAETELLNEQLAALRAQFTAEDAASVKAHAKRRRR